MLLLQMLLVSLVVVPLFCLLAGKVCLKLLHGRKLLLHPSHHCLHRRRDVGRI